jgi:iron complex outermembrane receptor protein
LASLLFAQKGNISGVVKDKESAAPLIGANIEIKGLLKGTTSDQNGEFNFKSISNGKYTLLVSYLGYQTVEITVNVSESTLPTLDILLNPTTLLGREVVVVANRAIEGETPVVFSTLDKTDIETRYFAQDVPAILSELPSTTFYSESGTGIGYNYLSIRGFGQRRISVMINGVPQNDPEDHNVYWVDFPDFLGNVEDIQVQRGAGSSFYGPPAIGGSVNILTSHFSQEKSIDVYLGTGSYGSQKYSLSLNSGLLNNQYVLFGRVSQIKSNGYRERSYVRFSSYFFGAARFGKKTATRLHFYGGPIEDGLVYEGVAKFVKDSKELRRANLSYWEADENGYTYQTPRRSDELENFNQPHLELIHEVQINNKTKLRNTFFGIRGYGFFDYDGSWAPFSYYRLLPEFGFDVKDDPESLYASEVLIRAFVDNKQAGWLPQLELDFSRGKVILGGEFRLHRSLHWGRIQKGSSDLPLAIAGKYEGLNYIGDRRYYEYKGAKNIWSPFLHTIYKISPKLIAMFDVQYVQKKYRFYDEKFLKNEFDINYNFLNPRFGLNYRINKNLNIFGSFSRTSREPRLKTYYDAAESSTPESWGPVVPQFMTDAGGNYEFNKPLVNPESLNDFEIGLGYSKDFWFAGLNLFYMDFEDEIIEMGQVDRFGQPVTGNAPQTLHKGIEFSLRGNIFRDLRLNSNVTFSKNILEEFSEYSWGGVEEVLDGNTIAGFPGLLANMRLTYDNRLIQTSIAMQHVGKKYIHNFDVENSSADYIQQRTVDAFTVFNGMFGVKFAEISGLSQIFFQLHIQNIFNNLYFAHGYLTFGDRPSFFPAAERQLFVNLKITI